MADERLRRSEEAMTKALDSLRFAGEHCKDALHALKQTGLPRTRAIRDLLEAVAEHALQAEREISSELAGWTGRRDR